MKLFKRSLMTIAGLLLLLIAGLVITGHGYLLTSVQRTYLAGHVTANINDHQVFETREIKAAEAQPLVKHRDFLKKPLPADFIAELKNNKSAAFLVLQNGEVLTEEYFNGYNDRSRTNSFSMAKTVVTLLLGLAIEDEIVTSLDQAITDHIPEFKDDPMGKHATAAHFSLMNSGYEWVEHYYTPFSPTVQLYYGGDVTSFLLGREFSQMPGDFWEYSSASTQILGIFLHRAIIASGKAKSLSDYLSKKIWQPMGMNDHGLWHLDNSGMELVYCCLNTNARNYAKLGQLMLNRGEWKGQQLIDPKFIDKMIEPAGENYYGLSTWLAPKDIPPYYWFSGHLGQYIIVIPTHNVVIVRLGEQMNPDEDFRTQTLPRYVSTVLDIL